MRESTLLSGSGRLAAFLIADIQLDLIPAVTADSTVVPLSSQAYVESKSDKYVAQIIHKYTFKMQPQLNFVLNVSQLLR